MTPPITAAASCKLLLIGGSLRAGSSNTAALETARQLAPTGSNARVYTGLADLPHFNPDLELGALPESVADLRAQLAWADAVLFSTPEYAGALPGSFKNLLDWCVGEGLYRKPVGFINASPHAGGAEGSYAMLRVVLGYVNADIVEAACVRVAVCRDSIATDGTLRDAAARSGVAKCIQALIDHIMQRSPG
ncbi:MAG: hypothetical protein RL701_1620 [Pseudomonadota bacterium]